jgi:hypothetical protein
MRATAWFGFARAHADECEKKEDFFDDDDEKKKKKKKDFFLSLAFLSPSHPLVSIVF